MAEDKFLFDLVCPKTFTKAEVQMEVQLLSRQIVHLQQADAQERLLRAAGVAGWDPWQIPARLVSPRIRECLGVARELGCFPTRRTPTRLSTVLFKMALEFTETTDRNALAATLHELGADAPDLSPDTPGYEEGDNFFGFLDP
jgi:hypothetical protein